MRKVLLIALLLPVFVLQPTGASASACTALIHIGDSTTISMSKYIKADYERNGFTNVVIDAVNGRSIVNPGKPGKMSGLQAVAYWKKKTPDGRCWVIALGTNDVTSNNKQSRIDKMAGALGTDRALWVNVYVNSSTRPSYNGLNAFAWNQLLLRRGLNVYDWASAVKPEWLSSDGIHYTTEGSKQRSALIARAASGQ